MRILMISGLDADHFYGQSTRPYYLNKILSANGAKILHICPRPPKEAIAHTSFVTFRTRPVPFRIPTACRIFICSCIFRADVLYVHQPGWMKLIGIPLARLLNRPLVFDIHGSDFQELEETGRIGITRLRELEEIEAASLRAADRVIVVSPELGHFLQTRFMVSEDRISLVANGVDLSQYEPNMIGEKTRRLRESLRIPHGNRVVTFTCPRIERFLSNEIALEWFFEVVRILDSRRDDLTILILGGGKIVPPRSSSVLYTGFVEDLPTVLALSDVLVLPYPRNAICGGVRNKALEYFAAGKPVVSTTEGIRGIQEAVAGRDYLLADTHEEFAEKILDAISDETLSRKIGSSALALVKRYDWSVMGTRIHKILHEEIRKWRTDENH